MEQTTDIVFFSRYLPSMGGIENFTHSLAHKLTELDYKVTVVTTDGLPRIETENGVSVYRIPKLNLLSGRYPVPLESDIMKNVRRMMRANVKARVVINGRYYPLSKLGARLANENGSKPILIDHSSSYIPANNELMSNMFKLAEKVTTKALKHYDIDFYGVSKKSSEWLSTFGITSCGEITNAIDSLGFTLQASDRTFNIDDDKLLIAYAGRLIEQKGVLKVASLASKFPNDVKVIIAGSGPLEKQISTSAEIVPNLEYVGRLNRPDLASLLLQTDIFCFPSTYPEGLPTCLLEAAACRCAIITTENGGTEEIIPDHSYGFVINPYESDELEHQVKKLIKNPELRESVAEHSKVHVSTDFSWDTTATRLLKACTLID